MNSAELLALLDRHEADRIELTTAFPRQTSYRNPVLAEALKNLGYVNRYGRGVLRSQDALTKSGHPPAEFTFDAGFVLATVRGRP